MGSRVFRVGQLDADLLDTELLQLLKDPVQKASSLLGASFQGKFDPELTALIQLILYKFSIWDSATSYGAKLQDLEYTARNGPLSRRLLFIHGTLTIIVPYIHTRLRAHALSNAWPDAPSSDRRRKAWNLLTSMEASYSTLALASFVVFLWNGRYRSITELVLSLRLVPSRRLVKRDVSYEFMNRQMVWQAITEFLIFVLPLLNARKVSRAIHHVGSQVLESFRLSRTEHASPEKPSIQHGKFWSLPQDQCAICAENASMNLNPAAPTNAFTSFSSAIQPELAEPPAATEGSEDAAPPYPIYNPYIASCGDVFCYHCISERMMRASEDLDGPWECTRCGQPVNAAQRLYAPDIEVSSEIGSSDYEFSSTSDMDITDLSNSIGTLTSYDGSEN